MKDIPFLLSFLVVHQTPSCALQLVTSHSGRMEFDWKVIRTLLRFYLCVCVVCRLLQFGGCCVLSCCTLPQVF